MKRLLIAFMLLAGASTALRAQNVNSSVFTPMRVGFHYLFGLFIIQLYPIFLRGASNLFNPAGHSVLMTFSEIYIPIDIIETILFPP